MESIKSLFSERYSCRNYSSQKVSRQTLEQLLETAKLAPSATNAQPWKVIVVNQPENIAKLQAAYNRDWFRTASTVLIMCAVRNKAWTRADGKNHADIDLAILTDHLTLAATDMGLATCWVCNFNAKMITNDFGLDSNTEPVVLVPIGYSADDSKPAKKRITTSDFVEWK
ncbi:MAG: nitroreductase family protein [Salinivirgaceae bacterium]|nr:nitroreductase family protein [Salinivirgaceae bacterium]